MKGKYKPNRACTVAELKERLKRYEGERAKALAQPDRAPEGTMTLNANIRDVQEMIRQKLEAETLAALAAIAENRVSLTKNLYRWYYQLQEEEDEVALLQQLLDEVAPGAFKVFSADGTDGRMSDG